MNNMYDWGPIFMLFLIHYRWCWSYMYVYSAEENPRVSEAVKRLGSGMLLSRNTWSLVYQLTDLSPRISRNFVC